MVPLISYKDYIKNASDKEEARKHLKSRIQEEKMDISCAAQHLHCARKTIRNILTEEDLDFEKRKAPHSCPHKLTEEQEAEICDLRAETGYGPDMLKLNFDLSYSTSTIYRVLVAHNMIEQPIRAYKDKRRSSSLKKKLRVFEKWQLDTKYLDDIPNLVGPIYQGIVPRYEYTLRDMVTGTTFVGFGVKERCVKDTLTFTSLCMYHLQQHGIDTHYVRVQSDNGPEIIGNLRKKDEYEIAKHLRYWYGTSFNTIPVSSPTYNSHVESFHGRIQHELYRRMNIRNLNGFSRQAKAFTDNWNLNRKALKTRKSPQMIAREYGYLLPECFYKFPVLFYDTLHSNSFSKSGDYLPDDLNLK
jgi:transposase